MAVAGINVSDVLPIRTQPTHMNHSAEFSPRQQTAAYHHVSSKSLNNISKSSLNNTA